MINQLDTEAFLWLNSFNNDYLDSIMLWITARNSWIPMYVIIVGVIIWSQKRKSIGILLMIIFSIIISDQVCSSILKPLIHRLRPCHEPSVQHLVHLIGNCGGQFGFCSSHAANTFALVTSLIFLFGKQFSRLNYLYVWAIIVSYSRIYVGVHYPLDVLAGAGIGVLAALFCYKLYSHYFSKKTMKKFKITLIIFFLTFFFSAKINSNIMIDESEKIVGIWLTDDKMSKIQIYKTNNQFFGKIIWMSTVESKEELKIKPNIGYQIFKKFTFEGKNIWSGGQVSDPRSGMTVSGKMTLKDENTLNVRGYLGAPMFGKTVILLRVE